MSRTPAKRFKRWSPRGRRLAYLRQRAQVERLEDRVLLSAEPMLQQARPDTAKDLSASDNRVTLASQPDGKLRVSADGLYNLVFAKPTNLFAIRGLGGADQVTVNTADLGEALLLVQAETIQVSEGASLEAEGGVYLLAESAVSVTPALSADFTAAIDIRIDGSVRTTGDLMLMVSSSISATAKSAASLADLSLTADARASAVLGTKASVTAAGVFITADTDVRFELERTGVEASKVGFGVVQKSEAGVRARCSRRICLSEGRLIRQSASAVQEAIACHGGRRQL